MRSVWETLLSVLLAPLLVTVLLFVGTEMSGVGPTMENCPQFEKSFRIPNMRATEVGDCNYVVILGSREITVPVGFLLIYSDDGEQSIRNVPAGTTVKSIEFSLKRESQ